MALTDLAIRNAKPSGRPQKLADGGNLYLVVTPAGGKLWRFNYRYLYKQKTLSLGVYPDVALAMARVRLLETKKLLASGRDPAVQANLAKITRNLAAAEVSVSLLLRPTRISKALIAMDEYFFLRRNISI